MTNNHPVLWLFTSGNTMHFTNVNFNLAARPRK